MKQATLKRTKYKLRKTGMNDDVCERIVTLACRLFCQPKLKMLKNVKNVKNLKKIEILGHVINS